MSICIFCCDLSSFSDVPSPPPLGGGGGISDCFTLFFFYVGGNNFLSVGVRRLVASFVFTGCELKPCVLMNDRIAWALTSI